jgi:hypothetical protein
VNRTTAVPILALAAALAWGARPALADDRPPAAEGESFTRSYPIHHLDLHEAEVLAWEQCPPGGGDRCLVLSVNTSESGSSMTVRADAATHAQIARKLLEADAVPRTQAFQIVLLVADQGAGGNEAPLPAHAAAALADVREFLPFRRYRTVDAAWLRTTREAEAVVTGPDGLPLVVHLRFRDRVAEQLFVEAFALDAPAVLPDDPGGAEGAKKRPRSQRLLATSFSMAVGETLVVGTSKLDGGDEALVVLLTAAP